MGARRQSREMAMHILYSVDVCHMTVDDAFTSFFASHDPAEESVITFARELADGVLEHKAAIDTHISDVAKNWDVSRMASIDRTVIRMATYELLYCKDVPVSVIINEAVEIAKEYSTYDSGKFVNGLLDKIKEVRKKGLSNGTD